MKRLLPFLALLLAIPARSEQLKTLFNGITGAPDYYTALSTTSVAAGPGISVTTTSAGVTITASGSAASNLAVNQNGVQISSPTGALNAVGALRATLVGGSTAQLSVDLSTVAPVSGSTNYVQANATSLQSGSTFYVSSGTVNSLYVSTLSVLNASAGGPLATIDNGNAKFQFFPNGANGANTFWMQGDYPVAGASFELIYSALNNGTTNEALNFSATSPQLSLSDSSNVIQSSWTTLGSYYTKQLFVSSATTVNGNLIVSSAVTLSNGVGTSGQALTSGGPGTSPTWTTISGGSGGSSTSTVLINGVILSSPTTSYNFIPGTGQLITGTQSPANTVNLTFGPNFGSTNTWTAPQTFQSSITVNSTAAVNALQLNGQGNPSATWNGNTGQIIFDTMTSPTPTVGDCMQWGSSNTAVDAGAACGTGGGGGTPALPTNSVQYNGQGSFAGSANFQEYTSSITISTKTVISGYGMVTSTGYPVTFNSSTTLVNVGIYNTNLSTDSVYISTALVGGNSIAISSSSELVINGSTGTSNQVVASQGPGLPIKWYTIPASGGSSALATAYNGTQVTSPTIGINFISPLVAQANASTTNVSVDLSTVTTAINALGVSTGNIAASTGSIAATVFTLGQSTYSLAQATGTLYTLANGKVAYSSFSALAPINYNSTNGQISFSTVVPQAETFNGSSVTVQGTGGEVVSYGVVAGSVTASSANVTGQLTAGTYQGGSLATCGSSNQALNWASGSFGCQTITAAGLGAVTSVTAGYGLTGGGSGGALTVNLSPTATAYIQNTSVLQTPATFYVSSGTVGGPLQATGTLNVLGITSLSSTTIASSMTVTGISSFTMSNAGTQEALIDQNGNMVLAGSATVQGAGGIVNTYGISSASGVFTTSATVTGAGGLWSQYGITGGSVTAPLYTFTSHAAPASPYSAGQAWNDSTQNAITFDEAGSTVTLDGTLWTVSAASGTISQTLAPMWATANGVGTLQIGANTLVAGKSLYIVMMGTWTANLSTGLTITSTITIGGTGVVASTAAIALTTGTVSNGMWELESIITCRTTGTSGTIFGTGKLTLHAGSNSQTVVSMEPQPVNAFNTTINNLLQWNFTWGTAAAANNLVLQDGFIEIKK